jgi:hypothetical protein
MVRDTLYLGNASITYTDDGLVVPADNLSDLPHVLAERGVAIVRGVLDLEECQTLWYGLNATMQHITQRFETPFNVDDESTWSVVGDLAPMHDTLHQQWGLSHCDEVWKLRANPKILNAFAKVYDVNSKDLVASIDGVNMGPLKKGYAGHFKLHSDQRFGPVSFETVQGWVTPIDVPVANGTLRFLDGSHKFHAEYAKRFEEELIPADFKGDWHVVSSKERNERYDFFTVEHGCTDSAIVCQAGDLVLWKSNTIHSGIEGWTEEDLGKQIGVTPRRTPVFRMAAYVSYMPRGVCKITSFAKRKKILLDEKDPLFGRTCSHYADMRRTFGRYPITFPRLARVKADEKWKDVVPYLPNREVFDDENVRRVAGL